MKGRRNDMLPSGDGLRRANRGNLDPVLTMHEPAAASMENTMPKRELRGGRQRMARGPRGVFACFALALVVGCVPPRESASDGQFAAAKKPTGPAVRLVVDFADGLEKHYQLDWRDAMTVLDALESASRRQRGIIYSHSGSGERAMVTAIDGLANEGGGGAGRNWIYRVNGELADKSCGVYEIRPDDVILWKFGTYDDE
jgi:hypothetical protein